MKDLNILVKHYAGSIAYGTNHTNSDVDFRGLFALDEKSLISPFIDLTEKEDSEEEDTKYYELSKYFKLVTQMNPNTIETLWVAREDIEQTSDAYEMLRENRDLFLNQKIANTTIKMAPNKIKSMKNRNKWINKPQPEEPPQQKDFLTLLHDFTDEKRFKMDLEQFKENHRLIPYDGHTILGLIEKQGSSPYNHLGHLNVKYDKALAGVQPKCLIKFNKEEYEKAKENHKNYWTWVKNRNEKRSELEREFGYDTKDAMHLVRMLRVGEEALRDGEVNIKRDDAQELKRVLHGEWSYDEVLEYANQKKENLEELLKNTSLPEAPDWDKLTDLLYDVYQVAWKPENKLQNRQDNKRRNRP